MTVSRERGSEKSMDNARAGGKTGKLPRQAETSGDASKKTSPEVVSSKHNRSSSPCWSWVSGGSGKVTVDTLGLGVLPLFSVLYCRTASLMVLSWINDGPQKKHFAGSSEWNLCKCLKMSKVDWRQQGHFLFVKRCRRNGLRPVVEEPLG